MANHDIPPFTHALLVVNNETDEIHHAVGFFSEVSQEEIDALAVELKADEELGCVDLDFRLQIARPHELDFFNNIVQNGRMEDG